MKTLICYKSKKGSTEKYANWLAGEIGADIKQFKDIKKNSFEDYDVIIVSSGTYMSLMPLNRFLKKKWKTLQNKKVIAVAVGAAPADDDWSRRSYNQIPEAIRSKIQYFKLLGEQPGNTQPTGYKSQVKKENLKPVIEYFKTLK